MEERMYELKKDVWTPGGYWRAGQKRPESEWRKEFNITGPFHWAKDWFLDLTPPEVQEKDTVKEIVKMVFEKHDLHSISYKEAAEEACRMCLIELKK